MWENDWHKNYQEQGLIMLRMWISSARKMIT